jgi:hypothetical protein
MKKSSSIFTENSVILLKYSNKNDIFRQNMNKNKLRYAILSVLILTGCVGEHPAQKPPTPIEINNERDIRAQRFPPNNSDGKGGGFNYTQPITPTRIEIFYK